MVSVGSKHNVNVSRRTLKRALLMYITKTEDINYDREDQPNLSGPLISTSDPFDV